MATIQRIYPRMEVSALSFLRRPTAFLGAWSQTISNFSATVARYMGPPKGTGQRTATGTLSAVPNGVTHRLGLIQILSDPLREQDIAAGLWRLGYGARLANAAGTFVWQGVASLVVVNGYTGQRRGTIFDAASLGAAGRTATAERTVYSASISGAAITVFTGDYLCLELGIAVTNSGAATVPQASVFTDGLTLVSSDNVATSDAQALLSSPQLLTLSLPVAGESPNPTVTFEQAVALVKEHFPPHSDELYDWDRYGKNVYQIVNWLGEALKVYGYDQVDRLYREILPTSCIEMLPAWEELLGIQLTPSALETLSIDERRALVLARLREKGPLTVAAVEAIFAALVRYAPGLHPDVLLIPTTSIRVANLYTDTLDAPTGIPVGTAFDGTNLIRYTRTILDGGVVWDAGVQVQLELSAGNTEGLRIQLTGPDGTVAQWEGGPTGLSAEPIYRSPAQAGAAIHGAWRLNIYRVAGAPAVNLISWSLYTLGKHHGGRGQAKFWWGVYFDPAHQYAAPRDIEGTLDRITQSYEHSYRIYSLTSSPGTSNHRAGLFIPGA